MWLLEFILTYLGHGFARGLFPEQLDPEGPWSDSMSKADVVATQKAAILAAEDAALEAGLAACFDQGQAEGGGGGLTQGDLDAAVAKALEDQKVGFDAALAAQKEADEAALAAQKAEFDSALAADEAADAVVMAEAQAKADADIAALSVALADMTSKEQMEAQAVADIATKIAQVQEAFDKIKALLGA